MIGEIDDNLNQIHDNVNREQLNLVKNIIQYEHVMNDSTITEKHKYKHIEQSHSHPPPPASIARSSSNKEKPEKINKVRAGSGVFTE